MHTIGPWVTIFSLCWFFLSWV